MAGSTWTWIGLTGSTNASSNWQLTSGPDNAKHRPQAGDTAIVSGAGVPPQFVDTQVAGNVTLDLNASGTIQFQNDTSFFSSSSIDPTVTVDAAGTATAIQISGTFDNAGTIEVAGAGNSLAITIGPEGTLGGWFQNDGTVLVDQGASLTVRGSAGATFSGQGTVVVAGGSALIDANLVGGGFSISQSGSLEIKQSNSLAPIAVGFDGGGTLKLDQPGKFSGTINNFTFGDTLDLGVLNIASIVYDGNGDIDAIGTGGVTLFSAQADGGALSGNGPASFALTGTGGIAGDILVIQGGGGDTVLTALAPSTWLWKNGASASANTVADWSLVSGPGNGFGTPQSGDSAINAGGTILGSGGFQLRSNTIFLGGTASIAALVASGGTSVSVTSPSLDGNSVISSAVPTNSTAEASLLSTAGLFVNQGSIIANGPAGSHFTLAIAADTANGTLVPGYFINDNNIEVDAGNTLTISVAANAELFNTSVLMVNGGSMFVDAAAGAIAGGYAPADGAVVIVGGGTFETNASYPATIASTGGTIGGILPTFAFADPTAGNTLKIDNIGSFGGFIIGFAKGDTIDLGTVLPVGKIAFSSTTGILALEDSGGAILDSLALASGNFLNGTTAVSGGVAGSFILGTGADGDTILTTNVQTDFFSNKSGSWQTPGLWSNGTPGALDSVLIGPGAKNDFTLTTGASPVSIGGLTVADDHTTLQITSETTSGPYVSYDFGGTIEVTGGNTLTTVELHAQGGAVVVDAAATLKLTGHPNPQNVSAIGGTITINNGNTAAFRLGGGSFLVEGGTVDAAPSAAGGGGDIYIGYDGGGVPGTATVKNGGVVTDSYALVGSDPTSFGVLTLDGGAQWTDEIDPHDTVSTRGFMAVGFNNESANSGTVAPAAVAGTATLVVENASTLTEQSYAIVGDGIESDGSVLVTNALWNIGTGLNGGFLDVGQLGSGTLTVDAGGSVAVGSGGTFVNNGSTFTGSGINVGLSATAVGTLTVMNGGQVSDAAGMTVAGAGQGLVQVFNGGTISLTGTNGITVGLSAGGAGRLIVAGQSNGAAAQIIFGTSAKGFTVGGAGSGMLDVESGGTIQMTGTGGIGVGQSAGVSGLIVVNGPNALLTEGIGGGGVGIGQAGTGTLEVENGGTVALHGTASGAGIGVGQTAGASGLIQVLGTGALLILTTPSSGLFIGQAGEGSLEVMSGGLVAVTGTTIGIGTAAGGSGSVTINGGTLIGKTTGAFSVGGTNASGTLEVEGGGSLSTSGVTDINATGSGVAAATVAGGTWTSTGSIVVGDKGAGSLDIGKGGLVSTTGRVVAGNASTGNGTITAEYGGTLSAGTVALGDFLGGASHGALIVGAGGFVQAGTLTDNAGGTICVSGAGAQISASTGISMGNGPASTPASMTIGAGGLVTSTATLGFLGISIGGGTLTSPTVTVNAGGSLASSGGLGVGAAPGSNGLLTVNGGAVSNIGALQIGNSTQGGGTAALVVSNGGSVFETLAAKSIASVSVGAAASALLSINGGQVTASGISINVGGSNQAGTLAIGASGTLINSNVTGTAVFLSATGTGTAIATVSGAGALWSDSGQMVIGDTGTGSLDINSEGVVNASASAITIGQQNGGAGKISLESGGSLQAGTITLDSSIGLNATGALAVDGGTVTAASIVENAGGAVSVSAGTIALSGSATIGQSGTGAALTMAGGGFSAGAVTVGRNAGSSGTVAVTGGTFAAVTQSTLTAAIDIGAAANAAGTVGVSGLSTRLAATGQITVGDSGSGSLSITNQATVQTGDAALAPSQGIDIGQVSGSSGDIAVSGTKSLLTNTGQFIVGDAGLGQLTIQSGGTVVTTPGTVAGLSGLVIAHGTSAAGSAVNVSGAGSSLTVAGLLDVGADGSGALSLNGGAQVAAGSLTAGDNGSAVGQISVTGAGTGLTVNGNAVVGDDGTGILSVLNGATFAAANLTIGALGNSSGALVVSGAGSELNLTGALNIGTALGIGDLTVGPGAAVHAAVVNLHGQAVLEGGLLDPTVQYIAQDKSGHGFGTIAADDILLEGSIEAGASGALQKLLVVQGTVVGGGTLTINGTAQASGAPGVLHINAGGTLELTGPVLNAATTTFSDGLASPSTYTVNNSEIDVTFADGNGVLKLDDIAGFAGTITSFQAGDAFVIEGGTLSGLGVINGNTLTVSDSGTGGTDRIIFGQAIDPASFGIVNGNTIVACFAAGTRIETTDGLVPVEKLCVGDRMVTVDGAVEPIVWIGSRTVDCKRHPAPETVRPVRVRAGAFGAGRPVRDVWLSPDHAVFVNGVLVPVKLLINGTSIAQVKPAKVTYYHVELPRHEVILAEGLPVESYLDIGDRANFADQTMVRLFPDFAARLAPDAALAWETSGAAPLVMSGEALEIAKTIVAASTADRSRSRHGKTRGTPRSG